MRAIYPGWWPCAVLLWGKGYVFFGFTSSPEVNPKSPVGPILDSTDE